MSDTSPLDRRAKTMQLIRYVITGGGMTLLAAGGYWLLATPFGMDPALSFTLVFLVLSGVGYLAHGAVSFRGHGARDRPGVRTARFFAVNLVGYAMNQAFIWGLVTQAGGPTWWPIIPMIFVVPLVTFALHRSWVYA